MNQTFFCIDGHTCGIRPSAEGWALVTGHNTIFVNDRDPCVMDSC